MVIKRGGGKTDQEGTQKSYSDHQTRRSSGLRDGGTLLERIEARETAVRRGCTRRGVCDRGNGIEVVITAAVVIVIATAVVVAVAIAVVIRAGGLGRCHARGGDGDVAARATGASGRAAGIAAAGSASGAAEGLAGAFDVCRVCAAWDAVQRRCGRNLPGADLPETVVHVLPRGQHPMSPLSAVKHFCPLGQHPALEQQSPVADGQPEGGGRLCEHGESEEGETD